MDPLDFGWLWRNEELSDFILIIKPTLKRRQVESENAVAACAAAVSDVQRKTGVQTRLQKRHRQVSGNFGADQPQAGPSDPNPTTAAAGSSSQPHAQQDQQQQQPDKQQPSSSRRARGSSYSQPSDRQQQQQQPQHHKRRRSTRKYAASGDNNNPAGCPGPSSICTASTSSSAAAAAAPAERHIPVHAAVLSGISEYFKVLIRGWSGNLNRTLTLEVGEDEADAAEQMVQFM